MAASWECPSLPMLSLPLKETAKTSFLGLKPLIGAHYEENPNTFSEEIRQLDQLREHAMRPTKDYNGCSVLRRYFAQLHLLRARFPPETLGEIPVDFVWKDAYSGAEYIQEGLQIEQASMLYNIAALHAQLGSHGKRDTEQEMKEAVTHFQCSAGAFSYLDEHFAINHASRDLSPEFVSFYSSLMLGQAQECLVEKSLKGIGRVKNATIARLATRVSEFYGRCGSLLEGGVCNVIIKKNRDWGKLLKFKVLYFQAIAHFYQAAHSEEMGKLGEMIALIQLTIQRLNSITGKPPKGMGDLIKVARQNFADHVTDKLAIAKRQNEQVYHDSVPQIDTVELISGADLVKPVSFHPTDPKNLGTDIFSRLIPMRAHEVASIYSEEKAKLMRSVISSVEEKDEELEQFMRSLNAHEVEKIHDGPPAIPDNILQVHQSLLGKAEEVRKLHSNCQELMAMSRCVEEDFAAIREMKKREETEEEQFQSQYGVRPVSQVCSGLWKEMESYHKYNSQASKSNTELKAMFDQHYPNLVLLTSPLASLKASLPKMTLLDTPAEDASESERWQHLLKEVEKMAKQRQTLVSRFREQLSHDDITKNLVGHLGNDQEVFMEDHMKQFKELATIIRQNLTAQENILTALTEANAKKASTRQTVQEITQQQQAMFASLMKSGGFLNLLQTKIQEGIGFYRKLQGSVSRLKKRAEEVCDARQRERHSMERKSVTPESPAVPSPAPTPPPSLPHTTSPPVRPPKKVELAGKPLPPDQQTLPGVILPGNQPPSAMSPDHSGRGLDSEQQAPIPNSSVVGVPLNPHPPTTQLDLQELQRIQMQQQALLGGRNTPPSRPPPLGEPQPTKSPSQLPVQHDNSAIPQDLSSPSQPVPDATQALNSLQVLLRPGGGGLVDPSLVKPLDVSSVHADSGGDDANNGLIPDLSQIPQRPPKPSHLKAGLLPSPFPSLPLPGEQIVEPTGSPLSSSVAQSNVPNGPPPPVVSGAPSLNLYPRATPSPSVTPEIGHVSITTDHHQPNIAGGGLTPVSPPLQPPSSECPSGSGISQGPSDIAPGTSSCLWAAQPTTGGSDNLEMTLTPLTELSPPTHIAVTATATQQVPSLETLMSLSQPPLSTEPVPYYQSNINIQPGEITLTTSSILGPIPSAMAVPSSTESSVAPSAPHFVPTAHTAEVTSAPPTKTVLEPSALELTQSLMSSRQDSENATVSTPLSVECVTAAATTSVLTQPQYTVSQTAASTSQSLAAIATESDRLSMDVRDGRDLQTSQPTCSSVLEDTQVVSQIEPPPESTGQSLQPPPAIEPQTQPPLPTHVEPPPASSDTLTLPTMGAPAVLNFGANVISIPNSVANVTAVSTGIHIPSLDLMATKTVGNLPSVVPLSLTSLSSLTTPLGPETLTDTTPLTTDLTMGHLAQQQQPMQIQLLQQSIEDQKKVIEIHRGEKEAHKMQEAAYRQQIVQLQQQLNTLQQKQDQEKAAVSNQQSALMQLLHQQQGMFSQQQSQMEKLSQLDESHRKEYLEVEEKFRESLRVEQEMKTSLQSQILQLTQENQKLNQTIQGQSQQLQTLQMQMQQYSVHIQERDKQLVAFKDQHKQIVDKLEQRSQQKVAQLIQKIQELQLELNRRREGPPSLPQPLQPTVVVPQHQLNPQQNQDLGPAGPQPNLPHPIQPNVPQVPPQERAPSYPIQRSGSVRNTASVHPGSVRPMTAPPPLQGTPGPVPMIPPEPMTPSPMQMRPPSSQPNIPLQMHPQNVRLQGHPRTRSTSQPPSMAVSPFPAPQQQHGMGIGSGGSVASPLTNPQPHVQPVVGMRPASIQSQSQPFVSVPQQMHIPHPQQFDTRMQQQQQQQQPASAVVFQSPPDPTLQQMHPQMVPHSMQQEMVPIAVPPQAHMTGQRFPVQGGPMRPNLIPGSQPLPALYGQRAGPHLAHYRGPTP